MTTYTATRKYHGKSAIVTVFKDGEFLAKAGGKRAERAQAVLLTLWARNNRTEPGIYGLRGDLHAAVVEADRLRTNTTMRHHGIVLDVTPADFAEAITITEEQTQS